MITIKSTGSFSKTEKFLQRMKRNEQFNALARYGQIGVDALSNATPRDSGATASGWNYKIIKKNGRYGIEWFNSHVNGTANIAVLIQYGHGTGTGGYVQGRDYINPAIRPVFDQIAEDVWKKVTTA